MFSVPIPDEVLGCDLTGGAQAHTPATIESPRRGFSQNP